MRQRISSSAEMKRLGSNVAKSFLGAKRRKKSHATVVALYGDLGAGKTTFTQGFLRELGVGRKVASPTFVVIKRYTLRRREFSSAFHLDCYRLRSTREILDLGVKEMIKDPSHVVLIEWPEKLSHVLPKGAAKLRFRHGRRENERNESCDLIHDRHDP